ncbi:MAG TPA: protein kinase, partial [Tepidisphaeraceae bacterium]|nr:protein kinase [Tepidisphaeraceae bacterium]
VGGQARGEVASHLACETALREFTTAAPGTAPNQVLWKMFNAANLAVYDDGLKNRAAGRMATTLLVGIFRNNELTVGHVGDCRLYLFQEGRLRRVTNDHSYAGVQLKLGLITVEEAKNSPNRSLLTRSVGQDPMIRIDYHRIILNRGDRVMMCSDGLYSCVSEGEISNIVTKQEPEAACRELIALAERRMGEDNISCQIAHVDAVEKLSYYGGKPIYERIADDTMGTDLEAGQTLDGRFQLTDLISRSGMASIFKANDIQTGQVVALKVPFMQFESDPGFYSRFEREEKIGTTLNHPYILRVEPIDTPKSRPYIVMEFLEGQTLAHLMRRVRPMPEKDALTIASRICEALHYMHDHEVTHRDLKPENIMICNDGSIRIMDFGIAKFEGQRRLTFGGFTPTMGTPDYMAPEQVKGRRGDPRTDIYALGAILYEMVTGSPPFEGANPFLIMNARLTGDPVPPRQKNENLSPQVEEIIMHAMARNPADRYPDARVMQAELAHPEKVNVTGRAARAVAPSPMKSTWARTRWYIAAAALPIAVALFFFLKAHLQWK